MSSQNKSIEVEELKISIRYLKEYHNKKKELRNKYLYKHFEYWTELEDLRNETLKKMKEEKDNLRLIERESKP
jgi:uncharacterized membrane protein YvbJ